MRWFDAARPLALLALGALAAGAPAAAQDDAADRPQLSRADRQQIARVEAYLESVDTMHARFRQVSSNGSQATGEVWIDRPGKVRFEYDPPNPSMIVSNGDLLLYWDRRLGQTSYVPISETPLWFLLAEQIDVSAVDGYQVARVVEEPGRLRIQVVQQGNWINDPGSVTLNFQRDPLRLREWQIVDQQGVATEVALQDARFGLEVDPDLFDFGELDLPEPGRQRDPGQ